MTKIAILYIGIGDYSIFWEGFLKSFEKNFLVNSQKDYYVFTDKTSIYGEKDNHKIHKIYQENLGWPGNTLFRYKMFLQIASELKEYDYIFFMNANVVCVSEITEKEFLPEKEKLLVVQHPGYYNRQPYEFPYERRKVSSAYIPYLKGDVYVCGGVNGGKAEYFIKLIEILARRIDEEFAKGIIAKWNDESHINRYIMDNSDYRLLPPSYCYAENSSIPFEPKLVALDKRNWIKLDEDKVKREGKHVSLPERIKIKLRNKTFKLLYQFKGEKWRTRHQEKRN